MNILEILLFGGAVINIGVWLIALFQTWTGHRDAVINSVFLKTVLGLGPLFDIIMLVVLSSMLWAFSTIAFMMMLTTRLWRNTILFKPFAWVKDGLFFIGKIAIIILLLH